jgi:diguanylate cyclase (GGDEF)-like protein
MTPRHTWFHPVCVALAVLAAEVSVCLGFTWAKVLTGALLPVAAGLWIAARERKLSGVCMVDLATGLPNRKLFHQVLEHELSRVRREDQGVGLFLIHCLGAKSAMKEVARLLQQHCRAGEWVARFNDDTFAVLAHCANEGEAAHLSERLLLVSLELTQGRQIPVAFSIGYAVTPSFGPLCRPTALLAAAESALETSTKKGPGRAISANQPVTGGHARQPPFLTLTPMPRLTANTTSRLR